MKRVERGPRLRVGRPHDVLPFEKLHGPADALQPAGVGVVLTLPKELEMLRPRRARREQLDREPEREVEPPERPLGREHELDQVGESLSPLGRPADRGERPKRGQGEGPPRRDDLGDPDVIAGPLRAAEVDAVELYAATAGKDVEFAWWKRDQSLGQRLANQLARDAAKGR
jgi:hypothetical protein